MSLLTSEQDKAIDQITQRLKKNEVMKITINSMIEYFHFCLASSYNNKNDQKRMQIHHLKQTASSFYILSE